MDTKYVLAGLAVVLVLGVFLPFGNDSKTVVERVSNNLGAVNNPDLNVGGVRVVSSQTTALNQATSSVICTLESPSSTSTLLGAGVQVTTATSGVSSLSLSKSTARYTVGNILASTSVASGAVKSLEVPATTTLGGMVFSPNTFIVVAQQGAGILNQSGSCNALFQVF